MKPTGFDIWHSRLGHTSNASIQKTVGHSIGIKNMLKNISIEKK
jgi:hypothetical protein